MPGDDRLEGQRALAQPADHHVAAGLDALGDGDLALARQQLDAAHLAQVHPHRIVGAAEARLVDVAGLLLFLGLLGLLDLDDGRLAVLGLLALDDLDAHLREIGHHVFDLLGAVLIRRQDRVQLVEGDVAALLAPRDQPLDGGGLHVEQGGLDILFGGHGVGGDEGFVAIVQRTPNAGHGAGRVSNVQAARSAPSGSPLLTLFSAAFSASRRLWFCGVRFLRAGGLGQSNFLAQSLHVEEPEDVPPPCLGLRRHRRR